MIDGFVIALYALMLLSAAALIVLGWRTVDVGMIFVGALVVMFLIVGGLIEWESEERQREHSRRR